MGEIHIVTTVKSGSARGVEACCTPCSTSLSVRMCSRILQYAVGMHAPRVPDLMPNAPVKRSKPNAPLQDTEVVLVRMHTCGMPHAGPASAAAHDAPGEAGWRVYGTCPRW
jgi:hypothetical protein